MRVLRVIPSMDPSYGGPCQGIRNSIPALKDLGIDNEVLCLDNPNAVYLGKDPFTIHAIGEKRGPWAYNKELIPWLIENVSHYDAIIIHGLWLYHSYAVNKALKHQKGVANKAPKVYVMPHGMLDPYFQKASGRKLKAIRNWLYWKLIEGKVVNEANGILFTSEEELKLARVPFSPYKPHKELNIGYGIIQPKPFAVEMREVFLKSYPILNNTNYILFLSRVHEKKGVDLLITAYLKLRKKKNTALPSLVIAGPGLETEFGEKVVALAGGDPNIVFTGMLTGDLKWGAFYGCEAFVLPSHQENFGIAVVEALACHKPVLVSDQVNIWREIEQEGGGIVTNDTPDGIEKLLNSWFALEDKDKLAMGENAFLTYTKYFTVEQAAKRMNEVLSLADGI